MDDTSIRWDKDAQMKFDQLIEKTPVFVRDMARRKVREKAESLAAEDNRSLISEKDLVDAFLKITPFGFHGPLKTDMTEIGIDYVQYGYPE